MYFEIFEFVFSMIAIIASLAIGVSCGIGLKPIFEQPKNLIVQLTLVVFGVILLYACVLYFITRTYMIALTS